MLICCSTQFSSPMLSPMLSSQFQFLQLSVRVIALPQNIYYRRSRSKNLGTLQLVDAMTVTSKGYHLTECYLPCKFKKDFWCYSMYAMVSIQGQKWQLYSETTIWERTVLILFRGKKRM